MTQVTIGGGRVVCEMDEAAQDEYKQVVGWLQKAIAEREALRAEADALRAIAQAALDRGGDTELVYAPLYQQALEDIASEEQDE